MFRKITLICLMAVMMFSMTAWGIDSNIKATLKIFNFGGTNDVKIYSAAGERFKKRFPHVEIVDTMVPVDSWAIYTNKLILQITGGNAPDVINMAIEGMRLLHSKGVVYPLDEFIESEPSSKELMADVDPALRKPGVIDGKLYYFPNSWNNMVIYYNKSIFKKAGIPLPKKDWTWNEFLEIAKKLTIRDDSGLVTQWGFEVPAFNFGLTPWFLTNDTLQLKNNLKESNLDDPKMLESLQFLVDLIHKHKVAPTPSGQNQNAEQLFSAGKLAMISRGHWPISGFYDNNFRDFDVQYIPRNRKSTSVFGVGGWAITKDSPNKELAWELIKEFLSHETMGATATAGVAIPARRSEAYSAAFLKHPENSKIFYDSIQDSVAVPSPKNFGKFNNIFMRHVNESLAGNVSPKEALQAAHKELKKAMRKVR